MNTRLVEQRRLITTWILRTSIGLSVLSFLTGLAVFAANGGNQPPHTPSGSITVILAYVWDETRLFHPSAFLDAGLLVVLFTPLARLLSGVVANVRAQDWLYVGVGALVTGLVIVGLFAGQTVH